LKKKLKKLKFRLFTSKNLINLKFRLLGIFLGFSKPKKLGFSKPKKPRFLKLTSIALGKPLAECFTCFCFKHPLLPDSEPIIPKKMKSKLKEK